MTEISLQGLDLDGYIDRINRHQNSPLHYAESVINHNSISNSDINRPIEHNTHTIIPVGEAGDSAGVRETTPSEEELRERIMFIRRSEQELQLQNMKPELIRQSKVATVVALFNQDRAGQNGDGHYSDIGIGNGTENEVAESDLDKTYVIEEKDWSSQPHEPPQPPTPPPRPHNRPRSKTSIKLIESKSTSSSSKSDDVHKVLYTLDEVLEKSDLCPDYEEATVTGKSGTFI